MARVIFTALADQDTADILTALAREAGYSVAEAYNARFEVLLNRVADHPKSCQARPQLGASIRVGVVTPYLVIYRYSTDDDTVSVVRILHGSRRLTRENIRGA